MTLTPPGHGGFASPFPPADCNAPRFQAHRDLDQPANHALDEFASLVDLIEPRPLQPPPAQESAAFDQPSPIIRFQQLTGEQPATIPLTPSSRNDQGSAPPQPQPPVLPQQASLTQSPSAVSCPHPPVHQFQATPTPSQPLSDVPPDLHQPSSPSPPAPPSASAADTPSPARPNPSPHPCSIEPPSTHPLADSNPPPRGTIDHLTHAIDHDPRNAPASTPATAPATAPALTPHPGPLNTSSQHSSWATASPMLPSAPPPNFNVAPQLPPSPSSHIPENSLSNPAPPPRMPSTPSTPSTHLPSSIIPIAIPIATTQPARSAPADTRIHPPSHGTSGATQNNSLKNAPSSNQIFPVTAQLLPTAESMTSQQPQGTIPPPPPDIVAPLPRTAQVRSASTNQSADSPFNQPTATLPSIEFSSEQRLHQLPPQVDRLTQLLNREVTFINKNSLSSLSVVIRPDAHTELTVQFQRANGQIEARIRCDSGPQELWQRHWPELQSLFADKAVRLLPLDEPRTYPLDRTLNSQSDTATHGDQRPPSQPDPESIPAHGPNRGAATSTVDPAPSLSRHTTHRGWQTWA
jgi:hypothetical protein